MEENRTELRKMEQNRTKWHITAHQNRAQAALQCRAEHGQHCNAQKGTEQYSINRKEQNRKEQKLTGHSKKEQNRT